MCSFLCLVLWALLLLIGLFVLAAVILWCETFQTQGRKATGEATTQAGGQLRAVTLPAVAVARPFANSDTPSPAAPAPPAVTLGPVKVARPFADGAKSAATVAPPAAIHIDPVEVARPFAESDDDSKKL